MSNGTTNTTTRDILKHLFNAGIFAWRQNVLPVPVHRAGLIVGMRPGSKQGLPDIMGKLPTTLFPNFGRGLCIEIKTGKDKLRPEQIGFLSNAERFGDIIMVVKDYEDFLNQWKTISKQWRHLQES